MAPAPEDDHPHPPDPGNPGTPGHPGQVGHVDSPGAARRVIVLGSSGSVGRSTLEVIAHLGSSYQVVGLAVNRSAEALVQQARGFGVQHLAVTDQAAAAEVRRQLPGARVHAGSDAAERLVRETDAHLVVSAIVGAAGLPATLAAAEAGRDIALANKETLVAAGELVINRLHEHGGRLVPVDSEHSAVFQCLQAAGAAPSVQRVVLTASGGPFRDWPLDRMAAASVEQALNHPTWEMGAKITVDSATMMNKALEIIEAHWLFGLAPEQIEVLVHPQSVVHSFVEFTDHCVLAQLGPPDMKAPIQYALTFPHRLPGCSRAMNWEQLSQLDFAPPQPQRFPSLQLAYRAIRMGGTAGAVLSAANEQAVAAFLEGHIRFGRIVELAASALETVQTQPARDLETVLAADQAARDFVRREIDLSGRGALAPSAR